MPTAELQPTQQTQASSSQPQQIPFYKNEISGDTIRETVDNSKLREILDAFLYSAVAVDTRIPKWKWDYDEKGKKIKRKVEVKSTVYQKLPTDIKVVRCEDFGVDDCDFGGKDENDTPFGMSVEFSETDVTDELLKPFKDHLQYKHNIYIPYQSILTRSKFRDWHPMMNRSGTDICKSYILGLTAPMMSTTLYREDEVDKMKHSAILDAKAIVRTIIQNHRLFDYDYEDSTKVSALLTFFYDLIYAVRSRNINGFLTNRLFQSLSRQENAQLGLPMPEKGLRQQWKRIVTK